MEKSNVSIIVPVYNGEKTIERCIKSILNQSYKDIEIIIVDDGSTDRTYEICTNIMMNYNFIKMIRQKNKGVSEARNIGIENAKGDYIMFVDADDTIESNIIETCVNKIENNDIIVFGYNIVNQDNNNILNRIAIKNEIWAEEDRDKKILQTINYGVFIHVPWNKFYKKEFVKDLRYNNNYVVSEDLIFNLEYLKKCKSVKIIENIGYNYIVSNGTIKYRKGNIQSHVCATNQLLSYFNDSKLNLKYTDEVECFFYNSIFYDLISVSKNKNEKIIEKIKEFKIIKKSDLYKTLKVPKELSIKKKTIFTVFKISDIITIILLKMYKI